MLICLYLIHPGPFSYIGAPRTPGALISVFVASVHPYTHAHVSQMVHSTSSERLSSSITTVGLPRPQTLCRGFGPPHLWLFFSTWAPLSLGPLQPDIGFWASACLTCFWAPGLFLPLPSSGPPLALVLLFSGSGPLQTSLFLAGSNSSPPGFSLLLLPLLVSGG